LEFFRNLLGENNQGAHPDSAKMGLYSAASGRRIELRILIPERISRGNPTRFTLRQRPGFVRKSKKPEFVAYPTPLSELPSLAEGAESGGLLELAQLRSIEIRPA